MAGPGQYLRDALRWFRQRKLPQVLLIYLGASWAILEATDTFIEKFGLPPWFFPAAILLLLIGLAVIVSTAIVEGGAPMGEATPERGAVPREILARRLPILTWPRAMLGGVLAFGALAIIGFIIVARRGAERDSSITLAANAVAVLPFRTTGDDLALWREGLMDVLSANLDGVGDLRAIDSRAVLARWNSRIGERDAPAAEALEVAGELGASWAIQGQAVELGNQVRLDARVYDPAVDEPIASARVAGSQDDILGLIEQLTLDLLRGLGQEQGLSIGGRALTSTSLDAVKLFLEGEQELRRAHYPEAIESLEAALEVDSTFAMAAARLSSAYGWYLAIGSPAATAAAEQALRFADRLPERRRAGIEVSLALEQGRVESIELARGAVSRYPDDAELLYLLGETHFHYGYIVDIPLAERASAFERAFALDSSLSNALIHPVQVATNLNDRDKVERLIDRFLERDTTSSYARVFSTIRRFAFGSPDDSLTALVGVTDFSDRELGRVMGSTWRNPYWPELHRAVLDEMVASPRPRDVRARSYAAWVTDEEIWLGRASAANEAMRSALELAPDDANIITRAAIYLAHVNADTAGMSAVIAAAQGAGLLYDPDLRGWLAAYFLTRNDLERCLAHVDTLMAISDSLDAAGESFEAAGAKGLALGLTGRIAAHEERHEDAVSILRESIPLSSGFALRWFAIQDQRFALALSLAALGQEEEALRILEQFHGNPYRDAAASLARGQLYEERGELEKAIESYSRVLTLYADVDPELRDTYDAAQRALSRLVSED